MSSAHDAVRRARSSFYWAMRLLPAERREAMFAVYAYCRALDDIADGPQAAEEKRARLAVVRGALAAFFETGVALDPLIAALAAPIRRFDLPRAELEALIDGMEADVAAPPMAPSMDELRLYCRRVAGSVGLLAVHVFERPDARDFALSLGEAMQFTNILRDVAEDAALGRLYLPAELLEQAVILARDPQAVLAHAGLPRACARLAALAEERFGDAEAELRRIGRKRLWPAVAMMATYRTQLAWLVRHGWRGPAPRVGRFTRLWIALKAAATQPP
ncbi:MAG: squalene/phytoene synthase family protein [Solirubrobacterales bacterium]